MLISHPHQFIFIHNYKVAGTSIKRALQPHASYSYGHLSFYNRISRKLRILPKVYSNNFPPHVKAVELFKRLPERYTDRYFKFGFVRNPYDWQLSLYHFMLKSKEHRQHTFVSTLKDFNEYIDWRVKNEVVLQKTHFYDRDTCLMDFIGKFETLQEDFQKICDRLNVKATLRHENKSRDDHNFLTHFSSESIRKVNEAYAEDFETFDYRML